MGSTWHVGEGIEDQSSALGRPPPCLRTHPLGRGGLIFLSADLSLIALARTLYAFVHLYAAVLS
jgi:hypothetical protein